VRVNQSRPKVRRSRALGIALTPKCAKYLEKRSYPPGEHGRRRRNPSDYAIRLREKQRLRHQYNVSEAQLRKAFELARKRPGKTGANLVAALEMRLDATVLRAGFARTIYQARQLVVHRHIMVNGQRVDRPSYQLEVGDHVHVASRSLPKAPFQIAAAGGYAPAAGVPHLSVNLPALHAEVVGAPQRETVPIICEDQLVVEFYSR
jgi:small subunit ribosomal protein S4